MDNGMIRKYEKAKIYAEEKDRIEIVSLQVNFDGKNNPHQVTYADGKWTCDCGFFNSRGRCSHTMALELILNEMIPTEE